MIDPAPLPEPAIERPAEAARIHELRDEAVLGTRMNLSVISDTWEQAQAAALSARAEIDRLDAVFNGRKPASELSRLNASPEMRASEDLFTVIAAAERWRERSEGAFSPRLGRVLDIWRGATSAPPARAKLERASQAAHAAHVQLDPATRTIVRPQAVRFALDGLAKGRIVDKALAAIRAAPGVRGAMVDIGGDIAASGEAPDGGWIIGVGDPRIVADNAPLATAVRLHDAAIATSGRGVRDRIIAGQRFSPTLDPRTGWPIDHTLSASALAPTAMEADAVATMLLATGAAPDDVAAWMMDASGAATATSAWRQQEAPELLRIQAGRQPNNGQWHQDWQALATFTAPRRQLIRDPEFRSPYVAMWITDQRNKPVRTLLLVGTRPDWQRDNYIWWAQNRQKTLRLISGRSMSTSGSGVYNVFWDGVDDAGQPVAAGRYVLHVETSREKGKHTYRSMQLDFSNPARFRDTLEPTEEGGGIRVTFDHY